MKTLIQYEEYSRKEVHRIFSPQTTFTPGAGTWGLQGIVALPNRSNNFVFFVTFGKEQSGHVFDEGITEDGVLSWQSQPSQSLKDSQIQQFLSHDELTNSIYLFLRTKKDRPYTYLGKLKYLSHDTEREKPVWFQWQILDWSPSDTLLRQMRLQLQAISPMTAPSQTYFLEETLPPSFSFRQGQPTSQFKTFKIADRADRDAQNSKLGQFGEALVLEEERRLLRNCVQPDLAEKVQHTSQIEGDGAGYDILSFTEEGQVKYIEVKTTTGGAKSSFFITSNELAFAEQHQNNYFLYRVYDFDMERNTGTFYKIKGEKIKTAFRLTPIQYRVSLDWSKE